MCAQKSSEFNKCPLVSSRISQASKASATARSIQSKSSNLGETWLRCWRNAFVLTSFISKIVKTSLDADSSANLEMLQEHWKNCPKPRYQFCTIYEKKVFCTSSSCLRGETNSQLKKTCETYQPCCLLLGNGGKTHCRTKQISKGCCIRGLAENQRTLAEGRKEWVKKIKEWTNEKGNKWMRDWVRHRLKLQLLTLFIGQATFAKVRGRSLIQSAKTELGLTLQRMELVALPQFARYISSLSYLNLIVILFDPSHSTDYLITINFMAIVYSLLSSHGQTSPPLQSQAQAQNRMCVTAILPGKRSGAKPQPWKPWLCLRCDSYIHTSWDIRSL